MQLVECNPLSLSWLLQQVQLCRMMDSRQLFDQEALLLLVKFIIIVPGWIFSWFIFHLLLVFKVERFATNFKIGLLSWLFASIFYNLIYPSLITALRIVSVMLNITFFTIPTIFFYTPPKCGKLGGLKCHVIPFFYWIFVATFFVSFIS